MKRLFAILFFIFACLSLTACDPAWYYHYNSERIAAIVAVELIDYEYPDATEISTFISTSRVQQFDLNKMTIIETVDEDKLGEILQDLSEVEVWGGWNHSDSPFGISLRIIYADGDFEVVSADPELPFFARYDSNGKLIRYIGMFLYSSDFEDIVNKHFNTLSGETQP
jgi:hypothetical protein